MKQAVLVVSFGTSYSETFRKNIGAIEAEIAAAFPGCLCRRAFTSGMIRRKLEREGVHVDGVEEALSRLASEGVTHVVIQPTHVMHGEEYDKLCEQAAPFESEFAAMVIGEPVLNVVSDYRSVVQTMDAAYPKTPGEALVLMGHGTEHFANAAYAALEYVFHDMGREDVYVGTVEGYPGLEEVLRRLDEHGGYAKVKLAPLMIVAGDHAQNDMAGEDADSWASQLEATGRAVTCVIRGLGELEGIRALLVCHAQAAMSSLASAETEHEES